MDPITQQNLVTVFFGWLLVSLSLLALALEATRYLRRMTAYVKRKLIQRSVSAMYRSSTSESSTVTSKSKLSESTSMDQPLVTGTLSGGSNASKTRSSEAVH